MRVFIPGAFNTDHRTGKGLFCMRLAKAIRKQGVGVVRSIDDKHDVSLHLIKVVGAKSKRVVRLDGVWHNTSMDYRSRNKAIAKSMQCADGVIYQSDFSKAICS